MTDTWLNLLQQFHFTRPWWLLALLAVVILPWLNARRHAGNSPWQQVIDPHLQSELLEQQVVTAANPWRLRALIAAAVLAALALAGPAWEQQPQPVFRNQDALVILLDQSLSMAAEDVKPSRTDRARQKILDILKARKDGQTAMLVYAGDAHAVTPLTDDADTIRNLLPPISPFLMPAPGSRPDKAIALAQKMLKDSGVTHARLLLITDGLQDKDVDRIHEVWDAQHFPLGILAVGTLDGAPVPLPTGGFLQDNQGSIVLARLDSQQISRVASGLGVNWRPLGLLDDDWQSLLPEQVQEANASSRDPQQANLWIDQGYWLVLLLLPVCLLAFRRGVVFCLLLVPMLHPQPAAALEWQDLWKTPDQQGAELLQQDPAAAASRFENRDWKGTAAYKAGDYATAAQAFNNPGNADSLYNQGNALARSGDLQGAINAWDKALELNPDMDDARFNRKQAEDLLKKQQDQQNQQGQNQNSKDQNSKDQNSKDQNQQGQNQQGQNQQGQNQQDQNQQGQNQQGQNQQDQNQQGQNQQGQNQQDQNQQGQNQQGQNQQGQNQQGQNQQDQNQQSQNQQGQNQQGQNQQDQNQQGQNQQGQDQQGQNQNGQNQQVQNQQGQANQEKSDKGDQQSASGQPQLTEEERLNAEQQARLQQWLNRVPDQPGKLLERKFLYQYSQQKQEQESGDVLW
ncbi:VWA domain-containing protein [Parathalassolituus penaei]|uniref:VWA domain-containing protein n=1 Tax=Parathalassolituus penaei TaxID=2997323 RepID=A0A9X3EF77_9GAMM|nr:VWA domain-containing protein [Parathalassolituus penaei]MCY0966498.1 VWA domain-containing protein [Parathalassolituus penaei]